MMSPTVEKLFDAIALVQKELPLLAAVIELADPAATPIVEGLKFGLDKAFEAVAKVRDLRSIDDLQAQAWLDTSASLQEVLDRRQDIDRAMASIAARIAAP